ncbi:MAG: hypothetical protein FWH15_10140, partial [Betaproteobacteria bacterium]|nr:hypothetical protein [Betaproteobacteria bacterium]
MTYGLKTMNHEDFLALKADASIIESDQHGEKVLRLADGRFLKLFRRKRLITSTALYPYAMRFVDNACALTRAGGGGGGGPAPLYIGGRGLVADLLPAGRPPWPWGGETPRPPRG